MRKQLEELEWGPLNNEFSLYSLIGRLKYQGNLEICSKNRVRSPHITVLP
jgi:hypothetical protein